MRLLEDVRNLLHRTGIDVVRWPPRPDAGVIDWSLAGLLAGRRPAY